jgi:Ca2+-binding RTX toxin-like protein
MMGTYVSISGGGDANVRIYGNGTVVAGNGNDSIRIDGNGAITVGAGNDNLTLHGSGSILQHGAGGNDTINVGRGHDTITEAGHATVSGWFGSATIQGGTVDFLHHGHGGKDDGKHGHGSHPYYEAMAVSGNVTLIGGEHCTQFVGGTASSVVMQGGTGNATLIGGTGHDTMTGGSAHNVFEFTSHGVGGTDVITNFVSGHDSLYLEGQSLCYLQSHGDITTSHGNTFIALDGGRTTIELKGFTGLGSHDITTHKG